MARSEFFSFLPFELVLKTVFKLMSEKLHTGVKYVLFINYILIDKNYLFTYQT